MAQQFCSTACDTCMGTLHGVAHHHSHVCPVQSSSCHCQWPHRTSAPHLDGRLPCCFDDGAHLCCRRYDAAQLRCCDIVDGRQGVSCQHHLAQNSSTLYCSVGCTTELWQA